MELFLCLSPENFREQCDNLLLAHKLDFVEKLVTVKGSTIRPNKNKCSVIRMLDLCNLIGQQYQDDNLMLNLDS